MNQINIKEFLLSKGVKFEDRGKWLRMSCLFPDHQDEHPSFFIDTEFGGYNCYGCNRKGNWKNLCNEMGWKYKIQGISINTISDSLWEELIHNQIKIATKNFPKPKHLENIQIGKNKYYQYLKKRKIEFLLKMPDIKLKYVTAGDEVYKSNYMDRILIPVNDKIGKFVWYEGRKITEGKSRKYYRPEGIYSKHYLFNYDKVNSKFVIIVEGIIDSLILKSFNLPVLCCFGSTISDEQLVLLCKFEKVIICLDNDDAGNKGYVRAKSKLINMGLKIGRIIMPRGQDINSLLLTNNINEFWYRYKNHNRI